MIALSRLLKTANKSQHPNQHAAMIFKGKSIIGIAYNTSNLHAEHNVINFSDYMSKVIKGSSIASIRIRNGRLNMAFPCKNCYEMIKKAEIRWILYTDKQGLIQKVKV